VKQADTPAVSAGADGPAREVIEQVSRKESGPHGGKIRDEMETVMMEKVGVYRNADGMGAAVEALRRLRDDYRAVRVQDESSAYNTDLQKTLELGNLLDLALITAVTANNRTESRGAHARDDFPERNDDDWLKHSLAWLRNGTVEIGYKSVDVSRWEPKPRAY
jgi:succinate dehydrogenase / fumarate reductase, flavoprotein subunit